MVTQPLRNTRASVEQASVCAGTRTQRWVGGMLVCFLLTFSGAWVLLIGVHPCILASLWWH
jgi:hypothetical protein